MSPKVHQTGLAGLVLGLLVLMGGLCAPVGAEGVEYLQDDVRISGDQINYFRDDGEMASVVVGNFRLEAGKRMVAGQRAVLWIQTKRADKAVLHDITVYVEDGAEVIEADGSTMQDKLMLVKLHVQGRITATGEVSTKPLRELPLYQRAHQVRQEERNMVRSWREMAKEMGLSSKDEPPVVVRPSAQEEQPEAEEQRREKTRKRETIDLEALGQPEEAPATSESQGMPKLSATQPDQQEIPTPPIIEAPVRFEAPAGVTIEKDPEDVHQRLAVAKGKIYLSQGARDSDEFLELRADSGVVFARDDVKQQEKDEKVPYAPKLVGLSGGGEVITGAYLEGDVIISRGERKLTGNAAYYDFEHEQAVIVEPVFRTIQEQRNIPVYVRGDKARMLSVRETKFYNAIVSTCDFKTPTYDLGAKEVTLRDETPYDKEGEQIDERRYSTQYRGARFDIGGVPVAYLFNGESTFEEGHTALRKLSTGRFGRLGWGGESEWHLFRLLGLVKPKGVTARLQASGYEKGAVVGVTGDYDRSEEDRQYSGYFNATGVYDLKAEDTFGDERRDIEAQHNRGRVLLRHKEFLPRDWQLQAELSLLSDTNFMEEFFPDEYWTGKEQENLLYAKKQRDNWAITALLKAKLNRFQTETESYPEAAGYLVGQSLLDDRLTYFGEARVGAKRYNMDTQEPLDVRSPVLARFDTRHEIDLPMEVQTPWGPLNVVPYATGRFTYWSDTPNDDDIAKIYNPDNYNASRRLFALNGGGGDRARVLGEGGVRTNMTFWRIYDGVESRLWDVHRLKHIITPELVAFGRGSNNVYPDELYPLDPNVESIERVNAGLYGVLRQRLQTKRGPIANRHTVDWMRLDIGVGYFDERESQYRDDHIAYSPPYMLPRFMVTNTEYSTPRSFINADYAWNISDSVTILSDTVYDLEKGACDTANIGVAVQRDPRMNYFAGLRYIDELDSAVGTLGFKYQINKKYSIAGTEQFDFAYNGGVNLGSRISIVRKLPRWYVGVTFMYDRRYEGADEYSMVLAIWPDGVPEFRIGGMRTSLLNSSSEN